MAGWASEARIEGTRTAMTIDSATQEPCFHGVAEDLREGASLRWQPSGYNLLWGYGGFDVRGVVSLRPGGMNYDGAEA